MDRRLKFETVYRHLNGLYREGMFDMLEKKYPDHWHKIIQKENEISDRWDICTDNEFTLLCNNLRRLLSTGLIKVRRKE